MRTVAGELPDWRRRLHDTVKLFFGSAASQPALNSRAAASESKNTRCFFFSFHVPSLTNSLNVFLVLFYFFFLFFLSSFLKQKDFWNGALVAGEIPTSQPGVITRPIPFLTSTTLSTF